MAPWLVLSNKFAAFHFQFSLLQLHNSQNLFQIRYNQIQDGDMRSSLKQSQREYQGFYLLA